MSDLYKVVPCRGEYAVKWRHSLMPFWIYEREYNPYGSNIKTFKSMAEAKDYINKDIKKFKSYKMASDRIKARNRKIKRECQKLGIIRNDNIST